MARALLCLRVTEELTRLNGVGSAWMGNQGASRAAPRVVPIVAEELRIERRRVTVGTVRVTKKTRSQDVVVHEPVGYEVVHVRRVPAGRFVDAPVPDRYVNGRLIVSVPEEVPVVVRRLRVVEELHIERRRTTAKRSRTVTLRRQKAIIERVRPLRSSLPEQNNRENPRPRAVRSK